MTDDSDVTEADEQDEDVTDDSQQSDGTTDDSQQSEKGADEEVASMYDQPSGGMPGSLAAGSSDTPEDASDSDADDSSGDEDGAGDDAGDEPLSPRFDAPLLGDDDGGPETATGTFYVKAAEDVAVILHEVDSTQIFTLIENPGFEVHDIVEASLVAQPPMEVSYLIDELEAHYTIPIETSPEPPTQRNREIGSELDPMEAVAVEREGEGEIHLLRTEDDAVERTADELHDDEMTYKNAARLGVNRVEIRTDEDEGLVSIRYLP